MSKADVMAGRAYVSLYAKNDISKTLNKLKTELDDFGSSLMGIGSKVAGMGLAITGSLTAAVMHFANVGSELNDMSLRTGMSTTALVELGYAAKQTGTSMDTVEGAIGKMQKNLGQAGDEADKVVAALNAIHLSVAALSGLSPDQQFSKIAEGIAKINDPARRSAVAMALFGGSGRELLPMIENIEALRQEARDLGIAPSPQAIAAADEIGDAIDRIKSVLSATVIEIGASIAPMAIEILNGFMTAVKAVRKFLNENKVLIVTVAKVGLALLAAGSAIMAVGQSIIWLGAVVYALTNSAGLVAGAFGVFNAVLGVTTALITFTLSPVGLLVAALIAGAYAWARFTESGQAAVTGLVSTVTSTFGGMLTTVTDTMGGIFDAIKAGDLQLAGQIAIIGLKLVFTQGLDAIRNLFGDTIGKLARQVLTGDFAGAWSTLGAIILDSIANIASGMVNLFSNAANKVMEKWQQTVNKISDYILQAASEGGAMGWALEQVSGVNMQDEAERGRRVEAERRAKGMKPDDNLIVDSTQYQDPTLQALKDKVKAAGDAANAMMKDATDATGDALTEATAGQAGAASAEVAALMAELAALKAEAAGKVSAINSGKAEESTGGGGLGSEVGMKGSAGSFSLAELAGSAGQGVAQKQLTVAQQMKKLQEEANAMSAEYLAALWGMLPNHP